VSPLSSLSDADLRQIERHGLTREEVLRQLALFSAPPAPARLLRPATVGDGVVKIGAGRHPELLARWDAAARAGRLSKFVPASGAASRMFAGLERADSPEWARFTANAPHLPFAQSVDRLRELPKGLLPFHRYAGGVRTPFEEHLVAAAAVVRDAGGICRLHVTVPPENETSFLALLGGAGDRIARNLGVSFDVTFSHQEPSTDTVAADLENRPFRLADGSLLFRPGGHGALLPNLEACGGDLVLVKNIDNVQREERSAPGFLWKKLLAGELIGIEAAARAEGRPARVAGVVRNQGEPGGGPFWVAGPDGVPSLQIVESSQVDHSDPSQAAIWKASTHFNPVDLAVSLRDRDGRPYRLAEFVDESAVFIARKSWDGRALQALERPGLWNGAMAGWKTLFVEIPVEAFTPVKTVFDLLRPEHLPETS
jgi:hypothetical protein